MHNSFRPYVPHTSPDDVTEEDEALLNQVEQVEGDEEE